MASITLYPPILDSTAEAFINNGKCRIYYSLSKFSSAASSSIKAIHVSVIKQSSGISVVNRKDSNGRYRSSGIIIINTPPTPAGKDNLYYVDILPEDIVGGWSIGSIYKIQIRLSSVAYDGMAGIESWLNINAGYFSEWSTYCTTKAIAKPLVHIIPFSYTNTGATIANELKFYNISTSTLVFTGTYSNVDTSENLYSYNLKLYDDLGELIEDSKVIYCGQYEDFNKINYTFRHEFNDEERNKIVLNYTTINNYSEEIIFNFNVNYTSERNDILIATVDEIPSIPVHNHLGIEVETPVFIDSEIAKENDEGRIALKLYSTSNEIFYGNIYLRRSSSRDNFETWEDFKLIPIEYPGIDINKLDLFYDNTIESGIWYKYGVQILKQEIGIRSLLNTIPNPIIREFEHNFLVGENGQQLKLPFNAEVSSYSYTILENKVDPISGEFPIISRNAILRYRTFPLKMLVSLHMDDMRLFLSEEEIFNSAEVANLYRNKRKEDGVYYYDHIQEREFREKVLNFLQDGKPKLFKSAAEGNIIVRLMNVTESPEKNLDRMIGSVSCNAFEIANPTIENYKKYNFINTEKPLGTFVMYEKFFGQCYIEGATSSTNIIEEIFNKYDHSSAPIGNQRLTLKSLNDLRIEIDGAPIILPNGITGYEINTPNGILQTINMTYSFSPDISFDKTSEITVNADGPANIIATFVYEQTSEEWKDREILSLSHINNLGQIYKAMSSQESIYNDIVQKHSYEWGNTFSNVINITYGSIEAQPGTEFIIKDSADAVGDTFIMNGTGRFDLGDLGEIYDIIFIKPTEKNIQNKSVVMINYIYTSEQGTFKEV